MGVRKNLALIFKYLKINVQKEFQYKTSFFMQIFMMIANNAFFIIQWLVIFSISTNIAGYGFKEVLLLCGISSGMYGVAHLFFGGAFHIGELVYEGKLDVYLTQPKNVLINLSCSSSSMSAIGDILYAFIALAIIGASWWWFLAIIPVCIVGGIIYVAIVVCFQSISFYIKRGNAIADMVSSAVTLFSNYPPEIFNTITKFLLYTIIPVGFIIFVPAKYIFFSFNAWWILGMIGFAVVLCALAFLFFYLGLKKYNSGNLMGGRL
ncbi:MAG: hypothetical protein HFI85_03810 [Clostridia bacterium]|jgi:ABC-2 type transport system permease protein|nr:hypothetical protein [Clostridia bacterium]